MAGVLLTFGPLYAVTEYMSDPCPVHDRLGTEMWKPWLGNPNWPMPVDLPPTHYRMISPRNLR